MEPKKKTAYHHGDLRRTLLDVSIEAIEQQGVEALNLRALAARAGVSSGAPYHHFADRLELLAAIAQEGFQLLGQAMTRSRDAAPAEAGARLDALGLAYVRFAVEHPGHFRAMFRGEAHPARASAQSTANQQAFRMLLAAIEDCQRAGRAPAGDPQPLVLTAWSIVHGLSTLWLDGALPNTNLDPALLAPMVTTLTSRMFAALARDSAGQPLADAPTSPSADRPV